jgi:hypothetical protein
MLKEVVYEVKEGEIKRTQVSEFDSQIEGATIGKSEARQTMTIIDVTSAAVLLQDLEKQFRTLKKNKEGFDDGLKKMDDFDDVKVKEIAVQLEAMNKLIANKKGNKKIEAMFKELVPFLNMYRNKDSMKQQLEQTEKFIPLAEKDVNDLVAAVEKAFPDTGDEVIDVKEEVNAVDTDLAEAK